MAAVLRVDLCEAIHLTVSQFAPNLCGYAFQIINFLLTQSQTFLLVVSLNVFDVLQRFRFAVNGEHHLVKVLVAVLQHRVVRRIFRLHFLELLNADNTFNAHVLGNFDSIGAPRCNHLAARPDEMTFHRVFFDFFGITEKPSEFGNSLYGKFRLRINSYNMLIIRLEETHHKCKDLCGKQCRKDRSFYLKRFIMKQKFRKQNCIRNCFV